jgi:hypothetical protein
MSQILKSGRGLKEYGESAIFSGNIKSIPPGFFVEFKKKIKV